jgi:Tfp pilus assembly protein PilN
VSAALNLARHPLRNERLPTLLLTVACVILAALTLRHAILASQLGHGGAHDVESQVVALDGEIDSLRVEAADLQRTTPPRGKLDEWTTIKELVDRRAFSWTGLFGALETALPPGVRLLSVAPRSGAGALVLDIKAVGRSAEDAVDLLMTLQASPGFDGAFLDTIGESADGVQITCTVRYVGTRPARPGMPSGAAPAARPAGGPR